MYNLKKKQKTDWPKHYVSISNRKKFNCLNNFCYVNDISQSYKQSVYVCVYLSRHFFEGTPSMCVYLGSKFVSLNMADKEFWLSLFFIKFFLLANKMLQMWTKAVNETV